MTLKRVPWISLEEWLSVKACLLSDNDEDIANAYETLLVWKARSPNLPTNEECTLSLIQALMQDHIERNKAGDFSTSVMWPESTLQTTFSMALVRFINHISALHSPQGHSLYSVAQKHNIPDWIVNLRHDIAHSSSLPPLDILLSAVEVAKQWLIDNYWKIQVWDDNPIETLPLKNHNRYEKLSSLAINAWIVCTDWQQKKIKKLCHVDDHTWQNLLQLGQVLQGSDLPRKSAMSQVVDIINSEASFRQMRENSNIGLRSVTDKIFQIIQGLAQKKKSRATILEAFKNTNFLKDFGKNTTKWAPLLHILHSVDSLTGLLEYLFNKLENGSSKEDVIECLKYLIVPLERLQSRFATNSAMIYGEGEVDKENTDWLQLQVREPPQVELDTIKPILLNPIPDVDHQLLCRYLKFVKLPCHDKQRSLVQDLMEIYQDEVDTADDNSEPMDFAPYTVEALPPLVVVSSAVSRAGPWKMLDHFDYEAWRTCPIGCLPGQSKHPELKLPGSVKWIPKIYTPNL